MEIKRRMRGALGSRGVIYYTFMRERWHKERAKNRGRGGRAGEREGGRAQMEIKRRRVRRTRLFTARRGRCHGEAKMWASYNTTLLPPGRKRARGRSRGRPLHLCRKDDEADGREAKSGR